jgi:predicted DNA-binding transcriptional regulator AlpA
MSTSPMLPQPSSPLSDDIFERLSQCPKLLTARELSGIITIKPKTLYSYAAQGLIPHYKIESNVRFRGGEIADWLREHARRRVNCTPRSGARTTMVIGEVKCRKGR